MMINNRNYFTILTSILYAVVSVLKVYELVYTEERS